MNRNIAIYRSIAGYMGWTPRRGIEEALKVMDPSRPGLYIVDLPTGYGKTAIFYTLTLSALLYGEAYGGVYAAPLRSLGDDVYGKWMELMGKLGIREEIVNTVSGLQHMGQPGSVFLNKPVVFTTFDTLFLHIHKIPPVELSKIARGKSLGHSEVSRARLSDSIVFLDEPHLSVNDEAMLSSMLTTIAYLARAGSTIVLATATMPRILLETIIHAYSVYGARNNKNYCRIIGAGINVEAARECEIIHVDIEDRESLGTGRVSYGFITSSKIPEIIEENQDRRIAIITNTRRRAKKLYHILRRRGYELFLLHSLILHRERSRTEEMLKKRSKQRKPLILVATQVVEAGFDVSFDIMITDPCPADSLIQRAGRVARWEGDEEGELLIVKDVGVEPYDEKIVDYTVRLLEKDRFSLKNPFDEKGTRGYKLLIENIYGSEYYRRIITGALENTRKRIGTVSKTPLLGVYTAIRELLSGNIVRTARILTLMVDDSINGGKTDEEKGVDKKTGWEEMIPAPHYLVKKLYDKGLIRGMIDYWGKRRSIDEMLRHCRGNWNDECLTLYMLTRGIRAFLIDRKTYEEIAYGEDL